MQTVADKFIPRKTEPSTSDKHYYSGNPFYKANYGMPNCTCYAFGRFWEISGKYPKLSTGNARDFYGHTEDGYTRSKSKPRLGAVVCWTDWGRGAGGHVAIVEEIYEDGSILTSNSAWGGSNFYLSKLYPPLYTNNTSAYQLQGFIYNPGVSSGTISSSDATPFAKFINAAKSQVGKGNSWTCSKVGIGKNQPWCAAFICACAKEAGILGKVIYESWITSEIIGKGVPSMGTFYRGPYHGDTPGPQVGDICGTMNSGGTSSNIYDCSHVGIVTSVNGNKFEFTSGNATADSNSKSKVTTRTYDVTDKCIVGYFRPKWHKVGGVTDDISDISGNLTIGGAPLYEFENTKDDATIREVCYFKDGEPSILSTDIKLSMLNYTTMLGPLSEVFATSSTLYSNSYDNGGVTDSSDVLIKDAPVDKNYRSPSYKQWKGRELKSSERDILVRIVNGEFGSDKTGSILIAQCLRDALVYDQCSSVENLPTGMGYDGFANTNTPTQAAKDAVSYVFDKGGMAVQHRILYMYNPSICSSAWHESQVYILTYGGVRFFDRRN